jgi:hypothetical protein
MKIRIAKYVDHLYGVIKAETLKAILGAHPGPFPTPKPMDSELRRKHALYGWRFELLILQISIATCSCCGRTKPDVVTKKFNPTSTTNTGTYLLLA